MSRWMQHLKETYSHMVYSRLLHEGSLNVGKPGSPGEPMQPAMRPMRPGDDPHQRLAAGREQLAKEWQDADFEEINAENDMNTAIIGSALALGGLGSRAAAVSANPRLAAELADQGAAIHAFGVPVVGLHQYFGHSILDSQMKMRRGEKDYWFSPDNPHAHMYVDVNGQPNTTQATPAKSQPKPVSNSAPYQHAPYQNPNPYGDWNPNKPSNR